MNAETIAKGLRCGYWTGTEWKACCPAHDDKTSSLSIRDTDDGKVLVDCFVCLDNEKVIPALRRLHLWEEDSHHLSHHPIPRADGHPVDQIKPKALGPLQVESTDEALGDATVVPVPGRVEPPETAAERLVGRSPTRVWRYKDRAGGLLLAIARWDSSDGKDIRPLCWVRRSDQSEGWALRQHPVPRPLYGLDRLYQNPDAPVLIVEGEKTADAAQTIFPDWIVTTWPGGAGAASKADLQVLAGRSKVVIWPDADEPGKTAAHAVADELDRIGIPDISFVDAARLAALDPKGGNRTYVAGWDAADAVREWSDIPALAEQVSRLSVPRSAHHSFDGYTMTDAGLFRSERKQDDKTARSVRVCAAFEVLGRQRDPQGNGWSKLMRWRDDDARVHNGAVADADLHGDTRELCRTLATQGLTITRGEGNSLADYLNRVEVKRRATAVARTGWHSIGDRRTYVLPDRVFGDCSNETVILTGGKAAPFEARGTLAAWRASVATLVEGQSRHVFAVSAAFAGPLLEILGWEGGGFHLYGNSSTGKTSALQAAASVWGRGGAPGSSSGQTGFVRSWRSTANAIEATAALHTDALLVLDEIGVADARDVGTVAYQLVAGTGKGRLNRDGDLKSPVTWRTCFLSTGEVRLADKLAELGKKSAAGQTVRMLEVAADAGAGLGAFDHGGKDSDPKGIAEQIKLSAQTHYGTAGPEFVERLISSGLDGAAAQILGAVGDFRQANVPAHADGQVLRAADRFGLVGVAGELAQQFGIVPWAIGAAKQAAERLFKEWLAERGGSEAAEIGAAISQVRRFIEVHGNSRFQDIGTPGQRVTNRAGFRRGLGEDEEWLVLPEVWKDEVTASFDAKAVARLLHDRGMLRKANDGYQQVVRVEGRTQRFYVVTATILSGVGDV